jgi:UDP:flavonoid glycosyltransferase YjiC (YdhE family)
MTRILAYTSPARGHLFPLVPILDELRDRGYAIALRTLGSEVSVMRDRGFDADAIDPAIESIEHDDYLARTPLQNLKRGVRVFNERARLDREDLARAIEDLQPDALLVDMNAWGALTTVEAWGGAWATWCPYPLPLPSREAPPFGPGFAPARGPVGRLRDRLLRPLVFGSLERIVIPPTNGLRAQAGLSLVEDSREMFGAPPLIIYMTAVPFEYPRSDWPPNIRMVGPCAWDPPAEPPEWLDGLDAPLVLVTTSSEFQADGRLAECALAAFDGEDVQVVVTLPSLDPAGFDPPPNARVLSFLPHGPLLDRAAVVITHGGMGATQKALARGVPVCAVPFGRDQLEVARRVEVAGAGTRVPAKRLSPERLRIATFRAMERRGGAQRIAQAYRDAGGAKAAADHFEKLLTGTPEVRQPR